MENWKKGRKSKARKPSIIAMQQAVNMSVVENATPTVSPMGAHPHRPSPLRSRSHNSSESSKDDKGNRIRPRADFKRTEPAGKFPRVNLATNAVETSQTPKSNSLRNSREKPTVSAHRIKVVSISSRQPSPNASKKRDALTILAKT